MMRSPGWRCASRSLMTESTGAPAGTSSMIARGLRSMAMNSRSEIGVAAVNDEIARLEVREQIVDDRIHGRAGGHEQHDRARLAKQGDELLDIRRAANITFL